MTAGPASDSAERRQLTVLFCDLVGSTALSEQMDPEDLRIILREYQQRCATVLRRFRGHVAQYLGDGLMVYFGYPSADEAAPRRAVEAGLGVVEAMTATKGDPRLPWELGVRVGIHTGPVVVGDMGDVARPERLAVGATPNVAARVQGEAEPNSVLLSHATYALVAEYFDCQSIGARPLRGVSRPITLHRVVGRGAVSSRVEASERRGFSPFAGRDDELALLFDRWTRSRAGTGHAVLVVGEAGVGKSRLTVELIREARGCELVHLTASEYAEAEPFYPIVDFLERWVGLAPGEPHDRRRDALAARLEEIGEPATLPELETLFAFDAPSASPGLPSPKRHANLIQSVVRLFAAMARMKPLLVVLEDLHWSDTSTQQFLEAWLLRRGQVQALTVATARVGSQLAWAEAAGFEVLPLGALPREQARKVALHVAGRLGAAPPADLLERVLDRADGIPLFVEELTRSIAELELGPSPLSLVPTAKSDPVPASLQDSLMARLDRLGSAKAIAQLAAVAGREVPLAWLDKLSPVGADTLRAELGKLAASGLLHEQGGAEPTYVFAHALMHEAAYQSLLKGAREELHQRVAEMLSDHHGDLVRSQPLLLAHHYLAAGTTNQAVRYLTEAGQRMLTRSALAGAIDVFRRALDVVPSIRSSEARDALEIDLLSSLGLAYISSRGYSSAEVEEVYSRARQLCERSGDVPLRVLYGVWAVHLVRADIRGISRLAAQFERIVVTSSDADALLVAHACLGVRAFFRTNLAEARLHCQAAWNLVDLASPRAQHERLLGLHAFPDILSGALWLSLVEARLGNESEARRLVEAANLVAERIGDPQLVCQAASYSAHLFCMLHRFEEVASFTEKALTLSVEHEFFFWHAVASCARGWLLLHDGKLDEAVDQLQRGLSTLEAVGSVINRPAFSCFLVEAHLQAQKYAEGLRVADATLALCRETTAEVEPELLRLKGELLVGSGCGDQAVDYFRAALAGSRMQGNLRFEIRAAVSLSRFLAQRNKTAEARDVLATSCRNWPAAGVDADEDGKRAFAALAALSGE
jgi:class 3 adenylate cyclase/tetratricopeptide (TPR) repeat protein